MFGINDRQFGMFLDSIHQKLGYNIECGFCDQGITDDYELDTMHSQDLFGLEFQCLPYYGGIFLLFSGKFTPLPDDEYIIRICKHCGHREYFDFKKLAGESYRKMKKEIISW